MTTEPSGEASVPTRGDRGSAGSPAVARSRAAHPADAPVAGAAQQDVAQASIEPAASRPPSVSGDQDQLGDEAAAGHRQELKAATGQLAGPVPDSLKMSVSLQNPVWDGPVQDLWTTQSLRIARSDSLVEKKTPRIVSVPGREGVLDPPAPRAQVQLPQNVPALSAADTASQPAAQAAGTGTAAEKPEGPGALSPDPEASPQAVTEGHSVDCRPLDSRLYGAVEEIPYMRSMTSLLAGGEVSIGSLANVLVWSETTMDTATDPLASGCSSATALLCRPGPRLHSVPSLLQSASSALSSWLGAGTGSVLRSVTHLLERVEQRTAGGICSAMRYLTRHLTPHHSGLSCD